MDLLALTELKAYLLPYQVEWINSPERYLIYVKSRRCGITLAESLWSLITRLETRRDHFFVSLNLDTAKEFLGYVKMWGEIFNIIFQTTVLDLTTCTSDCITLPNKSRIIAVSSNPDALRGMGGDVTLDELAFQEHADELYRAAKPVTDWGHSLRIISTENGPASVFHQLLSKSPENGFKVHKTTLLDAVEQGLALKVPGNHKNLLPDLTACKNAFIENKRQTSLSEDHFKQEYLCETTTSSTVISSQEYDKCILPQPLLTELDPKQTYGPLYIGVDVGRSKNLSVLWVLEAGIDTKAPSHLRNCYRTLLVKGLSNVPFQAQFEICSRYISHSSVIRCYIDAGGIGSQLAEDLYATHGPKVQKVYFNHQSKASLIEKVKKFVAQERLSLPNDPIIKQDILSMRRVATKSGLLTYDGNSGNSHCDYFMALSLALHGDRSSRSFEVTTLSETQRDLQEISQ